MSSYLAPDSHIRDKVKVVLYLANYATKELKHATSNDTSDLAAKKILLLWKMKLTSYTLRNCLVFQLFLNYLKSKIDDLGVGKLKFVSKDLQKLRDVLKKVARARKKKLLNIQCVKL